MQENKLQRKKESRKLTDKVSKLSTLQLVLPCCSVVWEKCGWWVRKNKQHIPGNNLRRKKELRKRTEKQKSNISTLELVPPCSPVVREKMQVVARE